MNQLVVPPLCLFLLAALGFVLRRKWRRVGTATVGTAAVLLVLLSTPLVAGTLLRSLECASALDGNVIKDRADAIVVLGADLETRAPEFGGATLGAMSLVRVRYAARLHRSTGEPVLTTGGVLRPQSPAVAALMSKTLREDYGVPTRWVEGAARNTWGNAERSKPLLEAAGVRRIHLVTHAWHMPRARACFEAQGFEVLPAPTAFRAPARLEVGEFLPSAKALRESSLALHEWVGLAWYHLRYL